MVVESVKVRRGEHSSAANDLSLVCVTCSSLRAPAAALTPHLPSLQLLHHPQKPKYSEIVNVRLGDGSVRKGQVLEVDGTKAVVQVGALRARACGCMRTRSCMFSYKGPHAACMGLHGTACARAACRRDVCITWGCMGTHLHAMAGMGQPQSPALPACARGLRTSWQQQAAKRAVAVDVAQVQQTSFESAREPSCT